MARGHGAVAVGSEPHVLVVAGSDSSGGAGIARDVETIAAFGLRTCLAVTAVTVQTHGAVKAIDCTAPALVAAQMRAALKSNAVKAIKIGLLGTAATAHAVAGLLAEHPSIPAVLDPVLAASSGRALVAGGMTAVLCGALAPLCGVITPNLPELAVLAGARPARDEAETLKQAGVLLAAGAPAIVVKGGHAWGDTSTDLLLRAGRPPLRLEATRLNVRMRGTGCMLASAIAAGLARGASLEETVRSAKAFVLERLHHHACRQA